MDTIKITVGNPNFGKGQTTLTIFPNGSFNAANICGKDTNDFKLQVSVEEAKSCMETISSAASKKSLKSSRRKGVPDEALYRFEFFREGKQVNEIQIWDSDLDRYPELKRTIQTLRKALYEQSREKILL